MQLSSKTRILNQIRAIMFKNKIAESFLVFCIVDLNLKFCSKFVPVNYLYSDNSIRYCTRDGINYKLDISQFMEHAIFFQLDIEPREALYSLVRKGMHIIDVGGNIGETTLNFARLTGVEGSVFSYEPFYTNYNKLVENVARNNFKNIQIYRVALSNKSENLLVENGQNKNLSAISLKKIDNVQPSDHSALMVESKRMDDFKDVFSEKKIGLIKIDVEGFEPYVLEGGQAIIAKDSPVLFIEINDEFLVSKGSSAKKTIQWVMDRGYQVFYAHQPTTRVNVEDDFTGNHFDIICTKK
jgi:FkbM family methyltransferase